MNYKKVFIAFLLVFFTQLTSFAQQSLWVGQSYTFDVSSSVMGITANVSWSSKGGYLSLSGSGFYRTITVTKYFSGTATVTCEWDYRLTGSGSFTHTKRQVTITCIDNQICISPTTLSLSPGETQNINYWHQYSNKYIYAADVTFQSSNTSVCTVNSAGVVVAKNPGTAYINVYSKISSVSPSCKVIVTQIDPTSIEIKPSLNLVRGKQEKLTPILIPSNASTDYVWISSDTNVASVSSSGVVTGIGKGNAIVSVTTSNGLTAQCAVSVDNPQLEIFCSHESGVVNRGCEIYLNSTDENAHIYYTLDNTTPTSQSIPYSNPIVIENPITLKAIAICEGYYQSDVLEREFEIPTLELIETNAVSSGVITNNVLYFKFNEPIEKGPYGVTGTFWGIGMLQSKYFHVYDSITHEGLLVNVKIIDDILRLVVVTEDMHIINLHLGDEFIQNNKGEQFNRIDINNLKINDYLNQDNSDLEKIKIIPNDIIMEIGEEFMPIIEFTPTHCKYFSCVFSSSDETVVSFDSTGIISAKNSGECEIMAEITLSNGNIVTEIAHVTVLDSNTSIDDVFIDSAREISVMIFTLQGNLIYVGSLESIPPLEPSIYIFKTGNNIRKVKI